MSDVAAIVAALRSWGLGNAAISGILGNLIVESSLSATAFNSGENALGIAQWEGGRRTALQQWAASQGSTESNINTQLTFMHHELQTGYSGVLAALRSATTPEQAATIWDSRYEVSAGTTRNARIAAANAFAQTGFTDAGYQAAVKAAGVAPASSGGGTTAGSGVPGSTSLDTYYNVDNLGGLLSAIPDLKALVAQAVAGKWSVEKFTNAVQNSAWWKSHSDTARSVIEERANDPAKWKQDLANTLDSVRRLSAQLGFPVTEARLLAIANNGLLTGNATNSGWLTEQLGSSENYGGVKTSKGLNGQMAQTYSQLEQMAADYGLTYTPQNLVQFSRDVVIGKQSLDFYKNVFVNGAKSRFPGVSDQLDKGLTLKQIADPYTQTMSQLLEISPESVNLNNPLIKQALQGTPGAKGTTPVQTPLWQFEQSVRTDPRWGRTQNARDTVSSALVKIGHDFGFSV